MAFGKEEKEVGYGTGEGTKGLGMLGQENDGRIRAGQIDQRTRAKLSKKNPGWGGGIGTASSGGVGGMASSLRGFGSGVAAGHATTLRAQGLRTSGIGGGVGGGGNTAGTASSIAFTPVQGLELVDPKVQAELSRKRKAEEDRWFKGELLLRWVQLRMVQLVLLEMGEVDSRYRRCLLVRRRILVLVRWDLSNHSPQLIAKYLTVVVGWHTWRNGRNCVWSAEVKPWLHQEF